MKNIPLISTAEEFLKTDNGFDDNDMELLAKSLKTENRMDISDISNTMIEFAKIHVEAALKVASNEWLMSEVDKHGNLTEQSERYNTKAILNAYPLENIK